MTEDVGDATLASGDREAARQLVMAEPTVLCVQQISLNSVKVLLRRYRLGVEVVADGAIIPGSYWGDNEAGLIGDVLYVRADTPIHSALHEASHFVCMDAQRRQALHRDAGGDFAEENAVCYLQILLAQHLPEMGQARMLSDMDAWGYTFRLGSAADWFASDAADACQWLIDRQLIDHNHQVTWQCR